MKLLLIDGHSILNRAYYGVPNLTSSKGVHTNAVYGFLNMMFSFLDMEKPGRLIVAFDESAPTFRHKMYKDYKGNRKGMDPELKEQVPMMEELLSAMNIPIVKKAGIEGDDILGTLSKRAEEKGYDVTIVSGDRDTLQLATKKIKISIPKTKKTGTIVENYYEDDVIKKMGVTPTEFIDVKALMGDSSDNIKGVPKIGEKTAFALIEKYHSIEKAYKDWENVTPKRASTNLHEYYDDAVLSKKLVTIDRDCDIDFPIEDATLDNIFTKKAYNLCKEWELRNILKKFENTIIEEEKIEYDKNFFEKDFSDFNNILKEFKDEKYIGVYILSDKGLFSGDNFYIFLSNKKNTYCFKEEKYFDEIMEKLLNKDFKLIFPNLKEACYFMPKIAEFRNKKFDNEKFSDIEVMDYILEPLNNNYFMDEILKKECNIIVPSKEELLGKKSFREAFYSEDERDVNNLKEYGYICSYAAASVYDSLLNKLQEENMYSLYKDIELPLIFTLYDMEKAGIYMDKEALISYGEELKITKDAITKKIYDAAGEEFNINSPKQLGEILFEKLQIKGGKKTKTGYSTAADVLLKLQYENPIIEDILTYRKYQKIMSTYVEGLASTLSKDKRVHSTFKQKVTATGRISSTEPNLQNIPIRIEIGKKIRKAFLPAKDSIFVDADYSQIELRVLADMSKDDNLIEAYREGKDIHRATAAKVFKKEFSEVTDNERRQAKAVNFGIVYGISAFGLSEDLHISRKDAKQYIDEYYNAYPKLKSYLDGLVEFAKNNGYAMTKFNRRRPIPELLSSNFIKKGFGERVAKNSPIQGTAADIIKIAMVRVHDKLLKLNLKSKLILQVHDELLIETKKDELEIVKEILITEMENAAELKVPLISSLSTGTNWYDVK